MTRGRAEALRAAMVERGGPRTVEVALPLFAPAAPGETAPGELTLLARNPGAGRAELPAMALLDRDGVYGAPRFYGQVFERGASFRPRVGAELTMEDGSVVPLQGPVRRLKKMFVCEGPPSRMLCSSIVPPSMSPPPRPWARPPPRMA